MAGRVFADERDRAHLSNYFCPKTLSKAMTWRAARAFCKVLDDSGCTWTATAEGMVQTMDDRQCHHAEAWGVEGFYRRGVVMRIDGASVRAQPGDGATVRVTVKGWAV